MVVRSVIRVLALVGLLLPGFGCDKPIEGLYIGSLDISGPSPRAESRVELAVAKDGVFHEIRVSDLPPIRGVLDTETGSFETLSGCAIGGRSGGVCRGTVTRNEGGALQVVLRTSTPGLEGEPGRLEFTGVPREQYPGASAEETAQ